MITRAIIMFGNGNWVLELEILDSRESFHPNWTTKVGPPEFATSLPAAATRISAHKTMLGYSSSRTFLTCKTALKSYLKRGRLTVWSRSV